MDRAFQRCDGHLAQRCPPCLPQNVEFLRFFLLQLTSDLYNFYMVEDMSTPLKDSPDQYTPLLRSWFLDDSRALVYVKYSWSDMTR